MTLLKELRHRQVFPLVGVYVVGAWVFIEVSSVFFPAWGIPDTSLRYLFIAAAALFPVVVLFGWLFDVRREGLFRTVKANSDDVRAVPLRRRDYAVLVSLSTLSAAVLLVTLVQVWNSIGAVQDKTISSIARAPDSVAILPFANLDPNPDTGYFSDGVTEEILHRLAATRALHVLGRTSSFAFRNSEKGPAEISEHLGVEYLLHGSIRRDGDFVRVTARLMDRTGLQVWSQTFDRKLESIFIIQSEIASSVAAQIVKEIVSSGGASATRATDNMEAYNEYLVGRALTHGRAENWHENSEAAFRRAIDLDPDFAPAYAGLAYSLFIMAHDITDDRVEAALSAARKSLTLDLDLAEGHAMLGVIQGAWGLVLPEEAEVNIRRAIELDPALTDAYNWLFFNLRDQGRLAEADAVLEQAYEIDPLAKNVAANFANLVLANRGEFERALHILERFDLLGEPSGPVISARMEVNSDYGRYAEAIRWHWDARKAVLFEALGMRDETERLLESIRTDEPHWYADLRSATLRIRGEHQRAWGNFKAYFDEYDFSFAEQELEDQAMILVMQILGGEYHEATERFESLSDGDPLHKVDEVGSFNAEDLINALGFAYLQLGDDARAKAVLSHEIPSMTHFRPWLSPRFLEPMALNAALLGDDDLAFERLSLAVEKGWANYYEAINDPRWGDTLSQPRFAKLLERVKVNLAKQRAEVEAMLASQSKS